MTDTGKKKRPAIDTVGWWVIVATVSASSMAFMMQSALNIALPAIQRDLNASGADLLWLVNSYALLLGALLLVGGSLGDHFGRRRVYIIGILLFSLSSIASGFAPTTDILILTRGIMGIGGALMIPGSLALLSAYFDSRTRGRAIGIWSAATTGVFIIAPVLGGFLAENGLWRGIFFLILPLSGLSLYALLRYVPESRDDEAPKQLDYTGAILITLGMAGIVYGATEIGRVGPDGFSDIRLSGAIIGGLIALVAFVWVEWRSDHPMMPLTLFRSRTFSGANLLTLFLYGALAGALFFLPLNLIQIQGYTESIAGLAILPQSIILALLSPRMGDFVDRYGPRLPLIGGPILVGIAFVALSLPGFTAGPSEYWTTYLPGTILLGIGMGIVVAPLTTTVMGSVPQRNTGVASGVNNAVSRSSGVLATAIMGGIALIFFSSVLTPRVQSLDLNDTQEEAILASAEDLAGMTAPDTLTEDTANTLRRDINESFIETFRLMMLIGAGLCFASAGLAAMTVEADALRQHDDSDDV